MNAMFINVGKDVRLKAEEIQMVAPVDAFSVMRDSEKKAEMDFDGYIDMSGGFRRTVVFMRNGDRYFLGTRYETLYKRIERAMSSDASNKRMEKAGLSDAT